MSIEDKSNDFSGKIIKPLAVPVRSREELINLANKAREACDRQTQEVRKEYRYICSVRDHLYPKR